MTDDNVPNHWEMFTSEANTVLTAAVQCFKRHLEQRPQPEPHTVVSTLDSYLAAVAGVYPEIRDTEPRELLARYLKGLLVEHGYHPELLATSHYAASLWGNAMSHDRQAVHRSQLEELKQRYREALAIADPNDPDLEAFGYDDIEQAESTGYTLGLQEALTVLDAHPTDTEGN